MREPYEIRMEKKGGDQILNDLYMSITISRCKSFSPRIQKKSSKSKAKWSKGNLYHAATKCKAEDFIAVLKQVLTEYSELSLIEVFDSFNKSGDTLLHVAVKHGNVDTLRLIGFEFPFLLTKKNSKGDTVWHVAAAAAAAKTHSVEVLKELINLRVGFMDHLAYSNNRSLKRKVTWGDISLREINEEGNTVLHVALINSHRRMAEQLVKQDWNLSYYVNYENKSALYLAAEFGYLKTMKLMLKDDDDTRRSSGGDVCKRLKGKSLVHAAIMGKHIDVLDFLLEEELVFRNEVGWAPLHWAASIGFLEGVVYLLRKYSVSSTERDENGLYPIHWASMNGHVDVIQELLLNKAPVDLLTPDKQNVLHVAAKHGQHEVINYILKTPGIENLINQRDVSGNTPLHYATMHLQPSIVSDLTWDIRVDLNLKNEDGFTPLDAAEYSIKGESSFRQWLTWKTLKSAGAKRASSEHIVDAEGETSIQPEPATIDYYKGKKCTSLSVLILVGTVYLVFHSTSIGAVNSNLNHNSDSNQASKRSILRNIKFHLYILCTTIAMSIFIGAEIAHIWGNINNRVFHGLAKPLVEMALPMSLASLSGVILLAGKLHWLADTILTMGMVFLVSFATSFIPRCFRFPSGSRIVRYITYYPIRLMLWLNHVV